MTIFHPPVLHLSAAAGAVIERLSVSTTAGFAVSTTAGSAASATASFPRSDGVPAAGPRVLSFLAQAVREQATMSWFWDGITIVALVAMVMLLANALSHGPKR